MSRSLLLAGLFLGCGDAETPACDEGFVKKNGRWCVYEEAPLVIEGAPDPGPDPDPDPGTDDPTDTEDPVDPSDYVTETEEIVPLLTGTKAAAMRKKIVGVFARKTALP